MCVCLCVYLYVYVCVLSTLNLYTVGMHQDTARRIEYINGLFQAISFLLGKIFYFTFKDYFLVLSPWT